MVSMFDFAKPALEAAGIKPATTWGETKTQTLAKAKAQLARTDLKLETAARWNHHAFIVAADMGKDARIDPRVTARQR